MTKRYKVDQRKPNSMKSIDELEHLEIPLSVKEAARIYGDSPGTFYRKVRRGEIPGAFREHGKPRGRIKICPKVFVVWLRQQIAEGCHDGKTVAGGPIAAASSVKARESEQNNNEGGKAGEMTERRLRVASG
jgi:Helix-turn-helix domain